MTFDNDKREPEPEPADHGEAGANKRLMIGQ
jgi:hypothetical protein